MAGNKIHNSKFYMALHDFITQSLLHVFLIVIVYALHYSDLLRS